MSGRTVRTSNVAAIVRRVRMARCIAMAIALAARPWKGLARVVRETAIGLIFVPIAITDRGRDPRVGATSADREMARATMGRHRHRAIAMRVALALEARHHRIFRPAGIFAPARDRVEIASRSARRARTSDAETAVRCGIRFVAAGARRGRWRWGHGWIRGRVRRRCPAVMDSVSASSATTLVRAVPMVGLVKCARRCRMERSLIARIRRGASRRGGVRGAMSRGRLANFAVPMGRAMVVAISARTRRETIAGLVRRSPGRATSNKPRTIRRG